jgi:hypothetical protein
LLAELAEVRRAQGQPGQARELFERAHGLLGAIGAPADLSLEVCLSLAELYVPQDDLSATQRYFEEARAHAGAAPDGAIAKRLETIERRVAAG